MLCCAVLVLGYDVSIRYEHVLDINPFRANKYTLSFSLAILFPLIDRAPPDHKHAGELKDPNQQERNETVNCEL
jgi:hypothetical protein